MPLSGHIIQELGRTIEDEFTLLIEGIGYLVKRKRNPSPSIDLIAEFQGKPIPETLHPAELLPPPFPLEGITAFSIKRGDFRNKDVNDLLKAIIKN
jgi:hypothetical protein